MAIPATISAFVEHNGIHVRPMEHTPARSLREAAALNAVPLEQVARAVVLGHGERRLLVIVPADRILDFERLREIIGRDLHPLTHKAADQVFTRCPPGFRPPMAAAFRLDVIIDRNLLGGDYVYFQPATPDTLWRVKRFDFLRMQGEDPRVADFAVRPRELSDALGKPTDPLDTPLLEHLLPRDVLDTIGDLKELPPMPQVAARILAIVEDPDSDVETLSRAIELDPTLAAQMIRWASSPFYGFRGEIESVKQAVINVLGFNLVSNIAMGLLVNQAFRVPREGPMGLDATWREAVFSAFAAEQIALRMPAELGVDRGKAYLAGLLHNIGRLVISHAFPGQHFTLNQLRMLNPHLPLDVLERHVLGTTESEIGAWLMQQWGLPEEIVIAIRWRDHADYWGDHAAYAHLARLATELVPGTPIAADADVPATLEMLGMYREDFDEAARRLQAESASLESLATQLAA